MTSEHTAAAEDVAPLARRLLTFIDLTSLNTSDDEAAIRRLVRLAKTPAGQVAAVCTWIRLVPVAVDALRGSGVPVAAVANFPDGAADAEAAAAETAKAVAAGASEVDVVFPYRAFLSGDLSSGRALVQACRAACGKRALLKVILETGQLGTSAHIRQAGTIAIDDGADFLKTSTGKTEPGATIEGATAQLTAIADARASGRVIGCKVSGGIRTLSQARSYLDLYESRFGHGSATPATFRIGASALTQELIAIAG